MMTAHSKRGASSAHRWWNCPGSIRECEKYEDRESVFAAEGSAAHALGEHCLRKGRDAEEYLSCVVTKRDAGWQVEPDGTPDEDAEPRTCFEIDHDMAEAVQVYLNKTRSLVGDGDEWATEVRLHLKSIDESMFGTADFVVYKPETQQLYVVDYKHGAGLPVEVKANPQLLYYALGAALRLHNRGVKEVTIAVVQPRCLHPDGPVREWTLSYDELIAWSDDLRAAVERTFDPNAPLKAGPWCKTSFCAAAPGCDELYGFVCRTACSEFSSEDAFMTVDPTTYDPVTLADRLEKMEIVEFWCKAVRDFAHHESEAGRTPPGYKIVPTRPSRVWKSDKAMQLTLSMVYGVEPGHFYQPPKQNSPAQMEKVLRRQYGLKGMRATTAINGLYDKVSKGTVIVPLHDEREPVKAEAAKDFE